MRNYEGSYSYCHRSIGADLCKRGKKVEVETWHAMDVRNQPHLVSTELRNVNLSMPMPETQAQAESLIEPQMPWAEEHFQERVSGEPLNPPPSATKWLKQGEADKHRKDFGEDVDKYSHTYPERFWPKDILVQGGKETFRTAGGIRFDVGDLDDVMRLLNEQPLTRQAYLPVWFPEDTGAVHRERVPCTLGYHFMVRDDQLYVTYMIRSVDYVRHFHDDVYLAVRLAQYVLEKAECASGLGYLTMHVMSMHAFEGDMPKLRRAHGLED